MREAHAGMATNSGLVGGWLERQRFLGWLDKNMGVRALSGPFAGLPVLACCWLSRLH